MTHGTFKRARRVLVAAALVMAIAALALPTNASTRVVLTTSETFSFQFFVGCAGEEVIFEGTLRTVVVENNRTSVVRQTWTRFHGVGYEDVGGVLVPTGTRWVFSGTTGLVNVLAKDGELRVRSKSVARVTSLGDAPNLRITAVLIGEANPATGLFKTRVEISRFVCE